MKVNLLLILSFISHAVIAQQLVSLEEAVALALKKNYDVLIATNSAKAANLDRKYANGAFLPRLNAEGAIVWNGNEQDLEVRSRETEEIQRISGENASTNVTGSIQLVWTLFDGTRMFSTRERLALVDEQSELNVKAQMVNTIASVITSYYDVVRQKQQLEAVIELMSVNEERVKLADRRLQVGVGAKPELLQARVDYNAQRAQVFEQQALIDKIKEQLNVQTGMQLPSQYDVSDTIIINQDLVKEEMLRNLASSNFSLQAIERNLRIGTLSIREHRAEQLPFVDFNAAYNYSRLDNTRLLNPFSPLYSLNRGFNYGFTVSMPLFNGFNQRRLIQQAKVNFRQQEVLFQQEEAEVSAALKNAFTDYANAKEILKVEEENILLAKENVAIALEVYKRGASTFVELRTAQQSLAEAYTRLINARYLAKVAETEILRLNGSLLR